MKFLVNPESNSVMKDINIYEYIDYRLLLKNLYEEKKKTIKHFSYRYIGNKVGFSSAGFFANILTGKRNISHDFILKFAGVFGLNKKETEYFENLVLYNQANTHTKRKYYFEKVLAARKTKVAEISADQYEYFDKWYYVAVRELLNFYPFHGDYQELGKMLAPPISAPEAKKAIDLLEKLALIRKKEDNTYGVTDAAITTVPHVPLVAIHNFQIAAMELAKEAIDRFPQDRRGISTLTLSLSKESYKLIEEKLASFRREVLELVKNDINSIDRVYNFGFNVYPMTEIYHRNR